MRECINNKGVVFIRCYQECDHYVIITKITNNYVYIFDPYYLDRNEYDNDNSVKMILNKPFDYNRRVTIERVFSETKRIFH